MATRAAGRVPPVAVLRLALLISLHCVVPVVLVSCSRCVVVNLYYVPIGAFSKKNWLKF
jgi:hypothetical protein